MRRFFEALVQGSPNEVIVWPLVNAAVTPETEDFRLAHPMADAVMMCVARKDCRSPTSTR